MYKFMAKDSKKYGFYRMKNCMEACDRCKMCSKDTRDHDQCWSACDNCNQCNANYHNTKLYDEPYEYRPWFLSVDNHNYGIIPYAKQYCDNVCGVKMCNRYRERIDNYNHCKRCQVQGKCWSPYQSRCTDCSYAQSQKPCENKYGCLNPKGSEFANVPPIDPMFTGCMPCWNEEAYTTL